MTSAEDSGVKATKDKRRICISTEDT